MKSILKSEQGQGIMEYVIIASLVGICCLMAVKEFGTVVQKRIDNMTSYVSNNINLKTIKR